MILPEVLQWTQEMGGRGREGNGGILETGQGRSCKILLFMLTWECKILSKEVVMSPSN